VSRTIFEKLLGELRPIRYTPNGKRFFKRSEIETIIERHREILNYQNKYMNPEIADWFQTQK
jgi:hypothetical protein